MAKNVHINSIKAYHEELDKISKRQAKVWSVLTLRGRPMTVREIMDELGTTDRNDVAPRVTELKEKGLIRTANNKVKCRVTGKTVYAVERV